MYWFDSILEYMNLCIYKLKSVSRFSLYQFKRLFIYYWSGQKLLRYLNLLTFLNYSFLNSFYFSDLIFNRQKYFTVIRSPIVHKKSREVFGFRYYRLFFKLQSYFNILYLLNTLSLSLTLLQGELKRYQLKGVSLVMQTHITFLLPRRV